MRSIQLSALIILITGSLIGQDMEPQLGCLIDVCNRADCGVVQVSYKTLGDNVFCEGTSIILENQSETQDFDFFIISWADGNVDTIDTYDNVSHLYNLENIDQCSEGRFVNLQYCYAGFKSCTDNLISCNWQSGVVTGILKPEADFISNQQACLDESVQFTDKSCYALNVKWDFGDGSTSEERNPRHEYNAIGQYTVTLTASNECDTVMTSRNIRVVEFPQASFDYSFDASGGCIPSTVSLQNSSSPFTATRWTITPDSSQTTWCFIDTFQTTSTRNVDLILKGEGEYLVQLDATNACGSETFQDTVRALDNPSAILRDPGFICESSLYTPEVLYTNESAIETVRWTFAGGSPAQSTELLPSDIRYNNLGTFDIRLELSGPCRDTSYTINIEISLVAQPVILSPPVQYCDNEGLDTLTANIDGGVWSGPGIVDEDLGVIDPTLLSLNAPSTIIYQLGVGECARRDSFETTLLEAPSVTITEQMICLTDSPISLTADVSGGVWSGDGIISADGSFDPSIAGTGTHIVTYRVPGADCDAIDSGAIMVIALDSLLIDSSYSLCRINDDLDLNTALGINLPSDVDINWMGSGITDPAGIFNATGLDTNIVSITIVQDNGVCDVAQTFDIILVEPPVLMITEDSIICIQEDFFQLSANVENGTWSGPGVDSETGEVDLSIAGRGDQRYEYVIFEGTSCELRASVTLTIEDLSFNLSAGDDQEFCEGLTTEQLLGSAPAGGFWMGPALLDSEAGTIDLAALSPDTTYEFQYCIASANIGNCSTCSSKQVTINANPSVDFSVDSVLCLSTPFQIENTSSNVSDYNWDLGNGATSNVESPEATYDSPGQYNIALTATSRDGCIEDRSATVAVVPLPTAQFEIPTTSGCEPFEIDIEDQSQGFEFTSSWSIAGRNIDADSLDGLIIEGLISDSTILIVLAAENQCGTDLDTSTIDVFSQPNAGFGFNVDEGCTPLPISFANTATGQPDTYQWDLGNGMMTTDSMPADQIYTNNTEVPIEVIISQQVANQCGTDILEKIVTINPPDVTAFIQLDTLAGCPPLRVPASNFSTPGSRISWEWSGDTSPQIQSSLDDQPDIVLTDAGLYTIILSASQCGTDTDTATVMVYDSPQASFSYAQESCQGDSILLNNQSLMASRYQWDPGDGRTPITVQHPGYVYEDTGSFDIALIAFNDFNCADTSIGTIEIRALPQLSIDLSTRQGCPPLEVATINNSPDDLTYTWTSSYNGVTSIEEAPTFSFDRPGSYTVSVTARNTFNCYNDTILAPIEIYTPPEAIFSMDPSYCIGHDTVRGINLSGGAVAYEWYAGDTSIASSQDLELVPTISGDVAVQLVAISEFQCRDSTSRIVGFEPSPMANFSTDSDAICLGDQLTITNQSEFSTDYSTIYGDGNFSNNADTYEYRDAGSYEISLIALADNSCPPDTQFVQVTVHPNPTAAFYYDSDLPCGNPLDINFTNTSDMAITSMWSLNGAEISREFNPVLALSAGINEVSLSVTNEFGCTDILMDDIEIFDQPFAEIDISTENVCANDTFTILNIGSMAMQYRWDIEGIGIFDGERVDIVIDRPGTYDVSLQLINSEQCQDSMTIDAGVAVYESPVADFSFIEDPSTELIGDVQFMNESILYERLSWDFGDGQFSQDEDPLHIYDINRPITVTLTASTEHQGVLTCSDEHSAVISPEYIATFFAPNALSPDNGAPEVRAFKPTGLGIVSYDIHIYSPWGELVWFSDALEEGTPSEGWDGLLPSGAPAPQGVYLYKANVTFMSGTGDTYTGSVHLIR